MTVPTHRHAVELDFVRYELVAAYSFAEHWDAWLRVPYDVKERTASVELIDPATPDEVAAMQRNLDLHHPTETLEGFSDFSLLLARKARDLLRQGDIFAAAVGTSLPVGRTEEDPYALGAAGLAHEHIQFGTGTFDPLLELYYFTPITGRLSASANVLGRLPLYENHRGFQGPVEVSTGLSLALAPTDRLSLRAGWSFFYQGYAHWDGDRDINSGLISTAAVGGASFRVADHVYLGLDVRVPVSQTTLSDDGDTFEQGTIAQLGVSYSL
ncbi:MAG: hypothetical protein WD226_12475 [Planctomycetota bacterium]